MNGKEEEWEKCEKGKRMTRWEEKLRKWEKNDELE
jgi:hypothetical protein